MLKLLHTYCQSPLKNRQVQVIAFYQRHSFYLLRPSVDEGKNDTQIRGGTFPRQLYLYTEFPMMLYFRRLFQFWFGIRWPGSTLISTGWRLVCRVSGSFAYFRLHVLDKNGKCYLIVLLFFYKNAIAPRTLREIIKLVITFARDVGSKSRQVGTQCILIL